MLAALQFVLWALALHTLHTARGQQKVAVQFASCSVHIEARYLLAAQVLLLDIGLVWLGVAVPPAGWPLLLTAGVASADFEACRALIHGQWDAWTHILTHDYAGASSHDLESVLEQYSHICVAVSRSDGSDLE